MEENTGKEASIADLHSAFLFEISADLEGAQEIGAPPHGTRRIIYVTGGTMAGPKLQGEVLPGGGDWLVVRPDGAFELDVRATCRTDDGHLIYTYYRGILSARAEIMQRMRQGDRDIDPSEYYFRTTPVFETGSEKYAWLNRIIAVGVGRRTPTGVAYTVYEIL
jgi:hypothetical protein